MKFHSFLTITLLLFYASVQTLSAQESVLSAGGVASGNEGTGTYSIGQVACHILTGTSGIISEGVQQPYEFFIIGGIAEEKGISLECKICPNPVETSVKLTIENHEIGNISYRLCDITGIILQNMKIFDNETIIPMNEFSSGIYILTITEKEKALKKFKIIKK